MSVNRLTVLAVLVLLAAWVKADKKTPAASVKVPDKLQPYVELSRLCAAYEKQVTVVQWREVWAQTYDTAAVDKWLPPGRPDGPANEDAAAKSRRLIRQQIPVVTADTVDGRQVAVVDATDLQNAYFVLGAGPLRGEFAIEIVAKAMSDQPCDMSISCMQGNQTGPGFLFGARRNTQSSLRIVNDDAPTLRNVNIPDSPRIDVNRWHTVRFEIRGGKATATVDGTQVATAPTKIDERAWTPNLYIFQSKVALDAAKIEAMAPSASAIDPAVAFAKVFGDRPREQVLARIAQLVEALEDNDARVRDGAYALLKPMGTLTRDALQGAIDSGSAEQAGRAQQLMDLLPAHAKPASN